MSIDVRVDTTPNPNAMKFTTTKALFDGRISYKKGDQAENELASQLLQIEGVDNIFGYQDFVTVNKTLDANWDNLLPQIQEIFENYSD